jgi:HEAT repeat protein
LAIEYLKEMIRDGIPKLVEMFEDDDWDVRRKAVKALSEVAQRGQDFLQRVRSDSI